MMFSNLTLKWFKNTTYVYMLIEGKGKGKNIKQISKQLAEVGKS